MSGSTPSPAPQTDSPGLLSNRACRPCVTLKAKCIPLAGSEGRVCERCHRLGKNCTTPRPNPRKRGATRAKSPIRSGRTEHIHGGSTTPSPQIPPLASIDPDDPEGPSYTSASVPRLVEVIGTPPIPTRQRMYSPTKVINAFSAPEAANAHDYFPRGRTHTAGTLFDVSPEIGHPSIHPTPEKLFDHFRDHMSQHFPFIVVAGDPVRIRMDRPFTYASCIMAAAHRDPILQYRISRDMFRYIAEHMMLMGEKSLDLLQGILIMMTWYHVYSYSNPQLMNLLHLAEALLVDLGLNRPPGTGLFQLRLSDDAAKILHGTQHGSHQHSLEERRAYLALYHVQAKLAACFRRLDVMQWSEHIEECCQVLQNNMERPLDAYCVAVVRLDHLVDRFRHIDAGQQKLGIPVQAYIKLFSADLDSFKQSLPLQLQTDPAMNLRVKNAQICPLERTIHSDTSVPSHKVEALHTCLAGVVGYFDAFLQQKADELPQLPFLAWSTIAHAFDIYGKLSFADVENWDLDYVRNNPGFVTISESMIAKLNEAQSIEAIRFPNSTSTRFQISITRLEKFKQWYSSRVDLEARARSQRIEREAMSSAATPDQNSGSYFTDFSDFMWQDFNIDWGSIDNTFTGIA